MGQGMSNKRSKASKVVVFAPKQHQMMSPDTRDAPLTPQVAAPRRSALDDIENFHAPTFLDFNLLDASGRLTPEDWSGITGLDDSAQWFDHAHPEQEVRSPIKARALLSDAELMQCAAARLRSTPSPE
eukprot:m.319094 g.319094  ORF g.319094 m.319094 type:complete len:128 (-) comp27584_c1_seq3:281-664(-)